MKKFLRIIFLVFLMTMSCLVWEFFLLRQNGTSKIVSNNFLKIEKPCEKPLEFSVGEIDSRFGISKDELIALAQEAEIFWDESSEKNILAYNPDANFKINLVFDERQVQTMEAQKLEQDLNNLKLSQEELLQKYEASNAKYEKMMKEYEASLKKYEKKLKEYNKDIEYWNEKGGAPEDEYEKLEDEQKELKDDYKKIEKQRNAINDLVKKTNVFAKDEKQLINAYNNEVITYKSQFGDTHEFEKGVFNGSAINIYQFQKKSDLRLTIIHELGHYLGLGHTENSKSIMHYLMGDQDLENPILTDEDKLELKRVCEM